MIPQAIGTAAQEMGISPSESVALSCDVASLVIEATASGTVNVGTQIVEAIEHSSCFVYELPEPRSSIKVWDHSTYRELADRLGPVRMKTARTMFEHHLARGLSVMRAASQDLTVLAREAHDLVSVSGMLGFAELSDVSRRLMTTSSIAEASAILITLSGVADRVIDALHREHQLSIQEV